MPGTFNYLAEIERDKDGRFVVTFPDFGWGRLTERPAMKR